MRRFGILAVIMTLSSCTNKVIISYGTSFGACLGYCITETRVDRDSIRVDKIQRAPEQDTLSNRVPIEPEMYQAILDGIDQEKFAALPERIGCPDCADGGAEWLQVTEGKTTKRVTFEYRQDIDGISEGVKVLRQLTMENRSKVD